MKKKLLTLFTIPLLLISCNGTSNPFADKSFSYESFVATYPEGMSEDTFFEDFTWAFALKMKTFAAECVSVFTRNEAGQTANKCLNFSNKMETSQVKYNDKKYDIYYVNLETQEGMEVYSYYSYLVDDGVAKFVFSDSESEEYFDLRFTGFRTDTENRKYTYLGKHISTKMENDKLIMKISLNFNITNTATGKVIEDRTAELTLSWNKK